jgi:hypothetical protein
MVPDLGSKGIFITENIYGENIDLKKYLFSLLPMYIFAFWYSRSLLLFYTWILMIASEYLLWDFPILTLRFYFLIIFSGPILLASIIDWKNAKIQPKRDNLSILVIIQTYVMLIFSYRIYYKYIVDENSDFKLFYSYSPFESLAYKFLMW